MRFKIVRTVDFILNRLPYSSSVGLGSPVLDMIRDEAGLKGTKCGCREGDCGACTVVVGARCAEGIGYRAVNSCILPAGELQGKHLVTIEGVTPPSGFSPLQQAFVNRGASQCGFCTPGMIMSITGYLLSTTGPTAEGMIEALAGNICRCTGYVSVIRAAGDIVELLGPSPASNPCCEKHREHLAEHGVIPSVYVQTEKLLERLDPMPPPSGNGIPVAGGTDIFVNPPGEIGTGSFHFLSGDPGLAFVESKNGTVTIGSATTVTQMMRSSELNCIRGFVDSLNRMGSQQIRNRATVGGNIVNASPIGDLTVMLLALGANLEIRGGGTKRSLPIGEFYRGYKDIDLFEGEILRSISFKKPDGNTLINFEKVSMRRHLDIASVNSAAVISIQDGMIREAAISAGGVAPVPLLLKKTNRLLKGAPVSWETVSRAALSAEEEISPIDDVRGSASYRRKLLARLVKAHFLTLVPELEKEADLP